jgi:hypothetical protein
MGRLLNMPMRQRQSPVGLDINPSVNQRDIVLSLPSS